MPKYVVVAKAELHYEVEAENEDVAIDEVGEMMAKEYAESISGIMDLFEFEVKLKDGGD